MKPFFLSLIVAICMHSCKREAVSQKRDCMVAFISNQAPSCSGWGIEVNNKVYPSKNIPVEMKQNGLKVCTKFRIYEDLAMCPCCGGEYASIETMELF